MGDFCKYGSMKEERFLGKLLFRGGDGHVKLHGLSPRANYTEGPPLVSEVIANFLRIEGATW
jgi:hypothetical protein